MNNLYIDYDKSLDIGKDIKQEYKKLIELLNKLNEISTNEELSIDLKEIIKLSEIIDVTGDFLINVSNAYKDVENVGGVIKVE
jgi:hypothetical protein